MNELSLRLILAMPFMLVHELSFSTLVGILLLSLSPSCVMRHLLSPDEITGVRFLLPPLWTLLVLKKDLGLMPEFSFVFSSLSQLKLLGFVPILFLFFAGLFDWYSCSQA